MKCKQKGVKKNRVTKRVEDKRVRQTSTINQNALDVYVCFVELKKLKRNEIGVIDDIKLFVREKKMATRKNNKRDKKRASRERRVRGRGGRKRKRGGQST